MSTSTAADCPNCYTDNDDETDCPHLLAGDECRNYGTEMDAYRLYRALEAYFNDVRTLPWFLQDVEVDD